ncbi:recombinase family protein [Venenivibrio stagnispumantis]|uniref:recombinase family protein n=1 Tax=Venenivibrio stagnispumantis TaxID=407998 RepID=UPI003CE54BC0
MKAVIYARYSSKNQDKKSIKDQVILCQIEADKRGDEIIAVFFDEAKSGLSDDREAYKEMLEYVKKNSIKRIYTYHTSRISRDTAEIKLRVRELKYNYGTEIIFVSQGITTEQENIELLLSANGIADEQYIESIRKNTWRGLYGRLTQGKVVFDAKFGYRIKDGELEIDEKEAEIVREIFNLYVSGKGFKEIARILNQRNIPSPRNAKWSSNAVREIITNEIYKGVIIWNKRQYKKIAGFPKRKVIPNPPSQWIRIERPDLRIIPEELWEEANNSRLSRRKGDNKRKGVGYTTLLGGFIKCECGSNLIKNSRTSFRCRLSLVGACDITASFSEAMLNQIVIQAIKQYLKENREKFKEELEEQIKLYYSKQKSKSDISKEIDNLTKKLNNILEIFEETPSKALAEKIKEYEEKINLLKLELKSFNEIENVIIDDEVIDILIQQIDNIFAMDIQSAREIISEVLEEVKIERDKELQGFYWINYKFKNPLLTFNRKINVIAGAGFEPATSGL